MSHGEIDLLCAILRGLPALPDAACRGRPELFDERGQFEPVDAVERRHAEAVAICRRCPEHAACAEWAARLPPSKRPGGVIAGEIHPRPPGRPAKGKNKLATNDNSPDNGNDVNDGMGQVSLEDCRLATLAVIHWAAADLTALNEVLKPIENDHRRTIAVLLGVLQTTFGLAPELREPDRIEHLRTVVAKLSADKPSGPPRRIY